MLRRLWDDETGITLAEVLIASAMTSIIATAFLLVFSAFSRNVSLEEQRAGALSEVQLALNELASELRQAIPITDEGPTVAVLDSAWPTAELIYYSDRSDAPGPELYRYYVSDCSATHCNLMREVTVADSSTPPWTHSGTPTSELVIRDLLIGTEALFSGIEWSGGGEVVTSNCGSSTACAFSLVEIIVRVDPDPNRDVEEPLRIRQAVRLRNG